MPKKTSNDWRKKVSAKDFRQNALLAVEKFHRRWLGSLHQFEDIARVD